MTGNNSLAALITANTSWYLYNFRKYTILAIVAEGNEVHAFAPKVTYLKNLKSYRETYQY